MQRLAFIDGLRGLAAVAVLLCHIGYVFYIPDNTDPGNLRYSWLWPGKHGVAIFFVISGLVMRLSLKNDLITAGYSARFIARRMVRLDPPYWCAIGLALLLQWTTISWESLAAHVTYLQVLLRYPSINGVFWTLAIEVQFYLLLLLFTAVAQRTRISLDVLTLPLLALSLAVIRNEGNVDAEDGPLGPRFCILHYYALFYLGTGLARGLAGGPWKWFAFGAVVCSLHCVARPCDPLLVSVLTSAAIYAARNFGTMQTWLAGPVWQYLGRISYSLYLVHLPIIYAVKEWAARLGVESEPLIVAASLVVPLATAAVFYVAIEKRALQWSRLIKKRPAAASELPATICADVA